LYLGVVGDRERDLGEVWPELEVLVLGELSIGSDYNAEGT